MVVDYGVVEAVGAGTVNDDRCVQVMLSEYGQCSCATSGADRVKVLMTTAASQVSKTLRAFHFGCNGCLVKPISKENLAKEINKLPLRRGSNAPWRGR